jgi:hypothetical protein
MLINGNSSLKTLIMVGPSLRKSSRLDPAKGRLKLLGLGKYLDGGPNSYIQRAGTDHTYFDLGTTKWKEAEALVNKSADEMWKINKKFIDEQKALNKEFYFSQEPWKAQSHEYLSKEAEYLIDLRAKDFPQWIKSAVCLAQVLSFCGVCAQVSLKSSDLRDLRY